MSHSICIVLDILQVAFSYSISFDIQRKENNNKNKWRNMQRDIVVKKEKYCYPLISQFQKLKFRKVKWLLRVSWWINNTSRLELIDRSPYSRPVHCFISNLLIILPILHARTHKERLNLSRRILNILINSVRVVQQCWFLDRLKKQFS